MSKAQTTSPLRLNFGILLLLLGCTAVVAAFALAKYLGTFKDVSLREIDSPGFTVVYKTHSGPYHQIVNTLSEVEKWAKSNNVPCEKTYGEFLDDPNKTEEPRLRSRVGCWLGEGQVTVHAQVPKDYAVAFVQPGHMVEATFAGSPAIGPWKVYPQVKGFMADQHLPFSFPSFEIYTVEGERAMTTRYLFPVR